ncbi:PepSY domain-containing protein [Sphingobacterium sp. SRCM116780]|uniref:PepSY domain-containing protein n=1 Tax=Sphingobacterium sp. SRCM116780 TaxID=2907623 RepID=UPI001F2E9738|nr:PepSY domain-containing protein [Sphingobacterium sp. SRCM116780]UIR56610.1 PepSY domain-containing protein [Sphingobacterium sp. SRCM116780]
MTLSIWRYAHLALAIVSSLFLLILSFTGVILAIDAINEKASAYQVENFNTINLAQSIPALRKVYPEIIEIAVDHNHFVSIDALDEEGNSVKAYIDPTTGAILGKITPKSQLIQWTTSLHRSLFIHETGRIIVGIVSFLLLLITISGIALILKRQQGIRNFFIKINRDFFAQYFHVVSGRLFLIPILIIALTGTYLFMARMELIKKTNEEINLPIVHQDIESKKLAEFTIFQQSKLADIEKIEFPFMEDDPEECYTIKFKDRVVTINQLDGTIVKETKYPYTAALEKLSLDIHTGRTNIIWAIILGLASLNILFFIYTGFVITCKRTKTKIKNKFKAEDAEIVLLVGSENGSTLFFANQIHKQLLADGKRSFLSAMNHYQSYPNAQHLLVFTSTYGLGTAPHNASNFENLLQKFPQEQNLSYAVIGFGSQSYPDYCAYATHIDKILEKQSWTSRFLDLHNVNDKSVPDFTAWIHHWSEKAQIALATAPALYQTKVVGLKKLQVVKKTQTCADNSTFTVLLKSKSSIKFQSGDLLAIYPANDNRERFYSIGRSDGMIRLEVKLHANGLGSNYLYQLEQNDTIQARVMSNPDFHFPKQASAVAMIANGTGIAPFLGMIKDNHKHTSIHLYAGFRHNNVLTQHYQQFTQVEIARKHLTKFNIAFSREQQSHYVMDLIKQDEAFFFELLENNGVIMICGSLHMQRDVEKVLEEILQVRNHKTLHYYKEKKQILTDCY